MNTHGASQRQKTDADIMTVFATPNFDPMATAPTSLHPTAPPVVMTHSFVTATPTRAFAAHAPTTGNKKNTICAMNI